MFERRAKPVDVYDHTNAMGSGFLCLFSTPFVIAICVFLAEAIFSSYWVALPLIIIGVPAFWIMIFYYGSTWTRKEAEARGRDWD